MTELFAPVCSITKTKRGRWFWAAWWTAPPSHVPFRKPDAEGGAAPSREQALEAAERRAGRELVEVDALWAKAWMRVLRGQAPWPSRASREPRSTRGETSRAARQPESVWTLLGVPPGVTEAELKAAYRKKAMEAHPDHGGDAETFRRIVAAYAEATKRTKRTKRIKRPKRTR